ncbi:MAG: biopolymer transporter ExbD [Desulfovibrio sp.]|jgi:biopolymer transport protein ExbD|nr:biopolymer transporter ExbD [Desulfovibrio sp.]
MLMRLRRKTRGARVEMLPLMDVVFLLLVFCIYAMLSMSPQRGLRLNLPASASATADRDTGFAVSLKADGSLYLDEEALAPEQLAEQLAQRARAVEKPGEVRADLFAEKEANLQDLYRVLDLIKAAGIEKIFLRAVSRPVSQSERESASQSEQGSTLPSAAPNDGEPASQSERESASQVTPPGAREPAP